MSSPSSVNGSQGSQPPSTTSPSEKEGTIGSMGEHAIRETLSNPPGALSETEKISRLAQEHVPQESSSFEGEDRTRHIEQEEKKTPSEANVDKVREEVIPSMTQQEASSLEQVLPTTDPSLQTTLFDLAKEKWHRAEVNLTPTIPLPNEPEGPFCIEERMKYFHIPGVSIAVINDGQLEWLQGYGEMKQVDQLSQAASISKVVASLTVLSLIAQCRRAKALGEPSGLIGGMMIDVDTDVAEILGKDVWEKIDPGHLHPTTIGQLLSHTGGICPGKDNKYNTVESIDVDLRQAIDKEQQLLSSHAEAKDTTELNVVQKRIADLKALREEAESTQIPSTDDLLQGKAKSGPIYIKSSPKPCFEYSNPGFTILQKVVEVVTERPFTDVVQERVLGPQALKMTESTYSPPPVSKTVSGNRVDGAPYLGLWEVIPDKAAAGMWTNARDLAKLVHGLQEALSGHDERVIGHSLALEMMKGVSERGIEVSDEMKKRGFSDYGLGIGVERREGCTYFMHDGGWPGFRSLLIANEMGQGAVVLINSDNGDALFPEIIRSIAQVYQWPSGDALELCRPKLKPEEMARHPINLPDWVSTEKGNGGTYVFHEEREGQEPAEALSISPTTSTDTPLEGEPSDPLNLTVAEVSPKAVSKAVDHKVVISFDEKEGKVFAVVDGGKDAGGVTVELTPLGDHVACYPSNPPGPYWDICRFTEEGGTRFLEFFGAKHILEQK